MLTSLKNIIGKKVETKSGQNLGRVSDVFINIDIQEVEQFEVRAGIISGFVGKTLLIHRKQVIEIKPDKLVVEDGIIKQGKLVPVIDADV